MPEYRGPAVRGGPERSVHRHEFVGVDVSTVEPEAFPGYDELRALTQRLLEESAELHVLAQSSARRLDVRIDNLAGHALPSGATADREMWLEVRVRDAAGQIRLESGTLDENGDLRVADPARTTRPGSDPALVLYTQHLYFDPALEKPPLPGERRHVDFLWQPNDEVSRLIATSDRDEVSYDLSALPAGSYTAEVRLLFRSFPPHLLRLLEREAGLSPAVAPRVPIMEMERARVEFALP